jgi:hypothetical protein
MKFSIATEGLINPSQFQAWRSKEFERIHRASALGLQDGASLVVPKIRADAARGLNLKRKSVATSFGARVHAKKKDVLPVVDFFSRIPWMGGHETGLEIRGKILIPMNVGRIGRKAFRALVQRLMASGNAFFKKVGNNVLLFAEYISENRRDLGRWRRAWQKKLGGGRIRRGDEIPIAILVSRVDLKKRIRHTAIVKENLPVLANAIVARLARG